ncbi:MAG: hypothetical protein ACM3OB_05345 [Acidobacteriota bacterium]
MRSSRRSRAPLLALVVGAAACAPGATRSPAREPIPAALQVLFRAQFASREGSGSLRLVLRQAGPQRYELRAADIAGRGLWRLVVVGDAGLLVDEGASRFCRPAGSVRLEGLRLPALPLAVVPRILLGQSPVPGSSPDARAAEEAGGRRWTWTATGGEVESWTLWQRGEAIAWWRRDGSTAVLSTRGGAQLRWVAAVSEPLRGPLPDLEPPAGAVEGDCGAGTIP